MNLRNLFIFTKYSTKIKCIILATIAIIIVTSKIITNNYMKDIDRNMELWIMRATEINELVNKSFSDIYLKLKVSPEEYPVFITITFTNITFFLKTRIINNDGLKTIENKKQTIDLLGIQNKTVKIEFVWKKQNKIKLTSEQNYRYQLQMAEGIVNVTIDEQCIKFEYQGLPRWHKKITIQPPDTIRHLLKTKCREGQTFAWPKNNNNPIIGKYTLNTYNNLDDDLNYENLPGIKHLNYELTTYGKCVNGSIKQMQCPPFSIYSGQGRCVFCPKDVYKCLTNMHMGTGIYTIPVDKEQSSYYNCIRTAPYIDKKTCNSFSLYDGQKCSLVISNICENTYTNKSLPPIFTNEPNYKNAFINCVQPQNPILIKCDERGLNKTGTDCISEFNYTYTLSSETFTLKPFFIERLKFDNKTGNLLEKIRAKIITKKEYIYKSINRSDPNQYDRNMDVYCEYEIPEYYFLDEKKIQCTSFKDCRELFKKPKIRVRCPALDDSLKFYSLSVYIHINNTSNAINTTDLILAYGPPEILTADEYVQIHEMAVVYAGSPINKSEVYVYNNDIGEFKIATTFPTLSGLTDAYWCDTKWSGRNTKFDIYQITNSRMTSDPSKFHVKDVITKRILSENNRFGFCNNNDT